VAYKTEIQIGVKGTKQLDELRSKIDRLSTDIDRVNSREVFGSKTVASINTYNKALQDAQENLSKTRIRLNSAGQATGNYSSAINQYVAALGKANGAQELTNRLIDQQISKQKELARVARQATGFTATEYGPQPAAGFDPAAGASQVRTALAEQQSIKEINQRRVQERALLNEQINNDLKYAQARLKSNDKVFKDRIAKDKEALNRFDQELSKRTKAKQSAKADRGKQAENLMLGAGFPLLFGGGPGQVAGGLLGSFAGTGFGGQIIGSALGQQLEDAVKRIADIGNALDKLDMNALRDSVVYVNADLETTVRRLTESGEALQAQEFAAEQVANQLGIAPGKVESISESVNRLTNTWNELIAVTSAYLGSYVEPIIDSFTLILDLSKDILKLNNQIGPSFGSWHQYLNPIIGPLKFAQDLIKQQIGDTQSVTEETEKRIAAVIKTNDGLKRELTSNAEILTLESQRVSARSTADKEHNAMLDYQIRQKKIEQEFEEKTRLARIETAGLTGKEIEERFTLLDQLEEQEQKQNNQNYLLEQQQIELEEIKGKYQDINEYLKAREATLEGEIKIFSIQQKSIDGILDLERSRNDLVSARLDLEESRLQRQLDQLNSINGSHIVRGEIIDQIAQRQIRQARIEHQNNLLSIDQGVAKAEAARKQVDFEVKRIQLQVESLKLEAQSIKDLGLRKAALDRIHAQEQSTLKIAEEMVAAADQQLATTREIAKNQKLAAGYTLQGKIEAIEASAAEQKRAAFLARSVSAQKELYTVAAATKSVQSEASSTAKKRTGKTTVVSQDEGYERGKLGATRTSTVTTSMPIDPDIKARVQGRGNFKSVEEMVGALEKAQRERNLQIATRPKESLTNPRTTRTTSEARRASAMLRYSPSGGNQGSASVNPTVNVTTGPVMNMDGQNYVNQSDFVAGLQSASTQGAEMALKMITSSGGARRDLGVG